jgi:hypothetical protein
MYKEMSPPADIIEQEDEKDNQPLKIINLNGRFLQHPGREVRTR